MAIIDRALYWFGYIAAHVLFVRAHTPSAVVRRLRLAYRVVGVRILETPTTDSVHRTIFLCPYRNLGRRRWGRKWLCHEKLDLVDDGYVTFLARHRAIDYQRPRGCEERNDCADQYCYSEVARTVADG